MHDSSRRAEKSFFIDFDEASLLFIKISHKKSHTFPHFYITQQINLQKSKKNTSNFKTKTFYNLT